MHSRTTARIVRTGSLLVTADPGDVCPDLARCDRGRIEAVRCERVELVADGRGAGVTNPRGG